MMVLFSESCRTVQSLKFPMFGLVRSAYERMTVLT